MALILWAQGWAVKGWKSRDESQTSGHAPDDAGGIDQSASTGYDRVAQRGEEDPAEEARHQENFAQ
jgi:hypothetical protein